MILYFNFLQIHEISELFQRVENSRKENCEEIEEQKGISLVEMSSDHEQTKIEKKYLNDFLSTLSKYDFTSSQFLVSYIYI